MYIYLYSAFHTESIEFEFCLTAYQPLWLI